MTEIRPEWLLELSPKYYDLASFPSGEGRQALQRVLKKLKKKANPAGSNKLPKRNVKTG